MSSFKLILVVLICIRLDYCSAIMQHIVENYLGTKTPYRNIAFKNIDESLYSDCNATRIWSIIRHGTRNPGTKLIKKWKENLVDLRDKIIKSQYTKLSLKEKQQLRNWNCSIDYNTSKFLVPEGELEMAELAERLQFRYPKILTDTYHPHKYKFKYTDTQRTLKSAEFFASGLFGRNKIKSIEYPKPLHRDPVLRFYKLCKRWIRDVDKNPEAKVEVEKFNNGTLIKKVINYVEKQIGVKDLNTGDIDVLYKTCAFETARDRNKISPWCHIFNQDTLNVLQFKEDLKYYWNDGYGFDLTYKQACPAIKDMLNHISPQAKEPRATFYFTHSGTILKILAHLGLYKDDYKLTHNKFGYKNKWNVGKIDTFGSNIAFVTYECKTEPKVLVLHQEKKVQIPGCPKNEDLCPLKTLKQIFKESLENCEFDEICKIVN